jgi:hypothetical protein
MDMGSGVRRVYLSYDEGATWTQIGYSLELETWVGVLDAESFDDGQVTIMAYGEDELGSTGSDPTPPTVTVVHIDLSIGFLDGELNILDQLDVKFTGNRRKGLRLNTVPGNFFEVITVTNTGTRATLPEVVLEVTVPIEKEFLGVGKEAFVLLGKKPVHVYLDGVDVTPKGGLSNLELLDTGQSLEPGSTLEVYIHFVYAFKGERYDAVDVSTWVGEEYMFEVSLLGSLGPTMSCGFSCEPLP